MDLLRQRRSRVETRHRVLAHLSRSHARLLPRLGAIAKNAGVSKANQITSIASLIASRYGKSSSLGGLVTIVAVIGTVPYLALQLKAVSTGFTVLTEDPAMHRGVSSEPILEDAGLWAAALLTIFAMLFGSRSIQPGERHHSMVAAVAFIH